MGKFATVIFVLLYIGRPYSVGATTPASYGCYTSTDPRNITISAGNYDPSDMGSSSCYALCGELGTYQYAAVTATDTETFCFCSEGLDSTQTTSAGSCTRTCSSGSADCGYYNGTYNTFELPVISSVQLTCDVSFNSIYGVTSCQTTVTGPASYGYQMDFGTGAGLVKVASASSSNRFPIPGEYDVISYVTDPTYLSQAVADTVSVSVQAPPMVESWLCPDLAATYEELCCNATVHMGSFLNATIDFMDTQHTFGVADTTWFTAGPAIPETTDTSYVSGAGTGTLVITDWLPFTEDGKVLFFEYLGAMTGTLDIAILSPLCSGGTSYCYETNSCSVSCNTLTCTASQAWSVPHQACVNASNPVAPAVVDRYAAKPGDLTVKSITPISITLVGSQIIDISNNPIEVNKGDIIASFSKGGRLTTRAPTANEKGVFTSSTTPVQGGTIASASIGTRTSAVYFLRAIAVKPTILLACHTYLSPNVYSVSLNLSNSILQNYTLLTTDVNVVEGINTTVIINDVYNVTNEATVFTLMPHSGNNITYEWFFGDGDTLTTSVPWVSHIYTSRGIYTVNVTAANMVSTKSNTSSITIEDRVANVSLSAEWSGSTYVPHSFYVEIGSGSDYTCLWDFNDGQTETTTEIQTPKTGSILNHTFTEEKVYQVTVTCSNNVSSDSATTDVFTIAAIVNIKLVKTGGLMNQQGWLNWTIDAGTNASFTVTYDGSLLQPLTYNEATKYGYYNLGQLGSTGIKPVVIKGSNVVSNETLNANFTIEEEIINPSCSEGQVNMKINDSLTFNCSMDGGTSVNIVWNYTDGSTDTHSLNTLERWTPAGHREQRTHTFTYPSIFNVSMTVSNNFNEFVFYLAAFVYNGIDGVSMHPNNPSSFNYGLDSPRSSVYFLSTSQYPPVAASVLLNWGDGSTETLPFQLNTPYEHNYGSQSNFTVLATVWNLVDTQSFSTQLHLVRVITNMQLFVSDAVTVGRAMKVCITLDAGDSVTLSCNLEHPAGSMQTMLRTATTPFEEDCFSHTYSTVGVRTIQCLASNPVMNVTKDYIVTVQEPVRAECYNLTASPEYTSHPAGGFTLTLAATGGPGCLTPTNARMQVAWDGVHYEGQPVSLSTTSPWTHTYTTAGEHKCTVRVSNEVSSVDFIPPLKWCGVYEPLGVMTIMPMYRPLLPIGGPLKRGYGPNFDNFPQNYPVIFDVSFSQGTVSTYIVAGVNANESAITVCDFSCGQDVYINFTSAGIYNITITAINPRETKSKTTTISMSDVPAGLSITTDKNVYAPGETVNFYVTTQALGDLTCYEIDLAGGSRRLYGERQTCDNLVVVGDYMGLWDTNMTFNATYATMGVLTATVTARNYVTATTPISASVTFSVSDDCDIPDLRIKDPVTQFYAAQEKHRCKDNKVEAIVNLNGFDFDNTKGWTIEKLNSSTGEVETIVYPDNTLLTVPTLYILNNSLDYGIYKLTFKVTLQKSTTSSCLTSRTTYIKVTHCPLVAGMAGFGITGGTFGFNKIVTFKPLHYSYDLDLPAGSDRSQGISCMFKCRELSEAWPRDSAGLLLEDPATAYLPDPNADPNTLMNTRNGSGCFGQGPGLVAGTGPGNCEVSFNTAAMFENSTYTWVLVISKGERTMRYEYNMTVTAGDPPQIVFRCLNGLCDLTPDGLRSKNVNDKQRYIAQILNDGPATLQSSALMSSYNYKWEVFCIGKGSSLLPIHNLTDYVQDLNSAQIAVSSRLFHDKFVEYGRYCDLKVKLAVSREGGATSVVSTVILVNSPPTSGSCDIYPRNGIGGKTVLTLNCSGWTDDDGIASYKLRAHYTEQDETVYKTMETDSWTGRLTSSSNPIKVAVEIKDKVGGTTVYEVGDVTITELSAADLSAAKVEQAQNEDKLNKLKAEGNDKQIILLAQDMGSIMNELYKSTVNGTQSESEVIAKRGNELTSMLETTDTMVTAVCSTQPKDKESVQEILSALVVTTKAPVLLSVNSITSTGNKISEIANFAKNHAELFSLEEMTQLLGDAIDIIEPLAKATNSMEQGVSLPVNRERTADTPFYFYDNSNDGETLGIDTVDGFQSNALTNQAKSTLQDLRIVEKITLLSEAVKGLAVPGEEPVILRTSSNDTVVAASNDIASNLLGSEQNLGDHLAIALPPLSDISQGPDWASVQNSTTLFTSVFKTDYNIFPSANSLINQPVINIEISTLFGGLKVTNTLTPIVITIPKGQPQMIMAANANTTNITSGLGDMDADGFQNFNVTDYPLMSHVVNVPLDQTNASVIFELRPLDPTAKFMVLTQCGRLNRWNATGREDWDYGTVDYFPNDNRTLNRWMLTATQMRETFRCTNNLQTNEQLKVYSAVYQINDTVYEQFRFSGTPAPRVATQVLTAGYRIKNEITGCYYYQETTQSWAPVQISQQMLNTTEEITLETYHLTAFSSGVAVAPNPIDWAFVWANADFFKNLTLYITEIVIAVLYIVSVIWARRKDMKDVEKLGLTPLIGNKPEDKYLYEIFIATGHRQNAGTESKVYMILSGDYDETEPSQVAGPGKKPLLQRGSTDGVLLATNRPLGGLNYLRVWHDNSGKGNFASWYCKYIMIQDLQTKEKYFFICDQWFAVEVGDGQVDRVIPVSGIEQMTEFSHLFSHTSQRKLGDDHLWYSVVARPPESRFTRVERVSCCLLLLYTNMLANGLFYERAKTGTTTALTFGPFTLTLEQLYVGMITNVIIFPINFLVVLLFRKSPPYKKRKSRVKEALEAQQLGSDLITDDDEKLIKDGRAIAITSPTPRSTTMIELETKPPEHEKSPETDKKKKFELPWWFRIIAWLLLWGGVGASAFFVTSYGIMFGDEKSKKWISSMIISFATSIFLTQPLQVVLMAMLFSAIFKKPSLDREEAEQDEEKPPLQDNEEWILPDPEEGYLDARPSQVNYRPPDPETLEQAREQRMKELKMYDILREIIFYCIFLWLLLVVSYTFRPAIGFTLKDQVRTNFIDQGLRKNYTFMEDFMKIATHRQFWNWLNITFLPGLVAGQWYNGGWLPTSKGFLADRANRIMGYATMRQLRVKPDTCEGMQLLTHLTPQCNEEYSFSLEDTTNYGPRWTLLGPNDTNTAGREHYTYRTGAEIDSYPFLAKKGFYGGGGYVVELRGSLRAIDTKIKNLIEQRWVDRYTRAVFLEFTTYNPGVNLFSIITIVGEFLPSGGIFPMYRVEPVTLLTHYGPMALFELAAQIGYGCFIIFFMVKEARNMHRQGRQYFHQFWNWAEMIIIFLSIAAAVIFVFRLTVVLDLTAKFKETHGNGYIKFQYVGYWQELLIYMVGWLVFLANLKFLKLLRFNRRMSMLAATLKNGAKPLFMFSIMFGIVFFAYVQFFYLIYYKDLSNFRTITHAVETCVQMMLGRFNFEAMKVVSPYLGSIWFFVYIISCAYILINMFVSILNESFTAVRLDIALQSNEHEMVEFIIGRFKDLLGIGAANDKGTGAVLPPNENWGNLEDDPDCQVAPSLEYNIEHFPQKVDRLLNCISKVYFDRNEMLGVQGAMSGAAGKAALLRLENKDEMRRMMARMMLTSFADPGNVKAIQKDFDMI